MGLSGPLSESYFNKRLDRYLFSKLNIILSENLQGIKPIGLVPFRPIIFFTNMKMLAIVDVPDSTILHH